MFGYYNSQSHVEFLKKAGSGGRWLRQSLSTSDQWIARLFFLVSAWALYHIFSRSSGAQVGLIDLFAVGWWSFMYSLITWHMVGRFLQASSK